MRVELEPAYVLHTRPYRDTSLLVDIFSEHYGRLTMVAKGIKKAKNTQRYLLQPFTPLRLSWLGKSALKNLIDVEAISKNHGLESKYLYSGLYVNELLSYLLVENDENTHIYYAYKELLTRLEHKHDLEINLRRFELILLSELGYGIDFETNAENGDPINKDSYYYFIHDVGFVPEQSIDLTQLTIKKPRPYLGEILLKIACADFDQLPVKHAAKSITRQALEPHLRGRKIKSRALFQ